MKAHLDALRHVTTGTITTMLMAEIATLSRRACRIVDWAFSPNWD